MNDVPGFGGSSNNNFKNQFGGFGMNEDEELDRALKENGQSETPYLDTYCKFMNEEAKKGEYDPVVGREKELSELIETCINFFRY